MNKQRTQAIAQNLALLFGSLFLCFLTIEVGYRVIDPFPYFPEEEINLTQHGNLSQYDPLLGWKGVPDGTSEFTTVNNSIWLYVTSYVSGCRYCQAHTILGSQRFGSTDERLNDAWNHAASPHFTPAEKAALAFAQAAAQVPNAVDDEVASDLRRHWSDDDIVEIMAVIALFGYLNRWNDSMGSALEDLPVDAAEKYLGNTGWTIGKHT